MTAPSYSLMLRKARKEKKNSYLFWKKR